MFFARYLDQKIRDFERETLVSRREEGNGDGEGEGDVDRTPEGELKGEEGGEAEAAVPGAAFSTFLRRNAATVIPPGAAILDPLKSFVVNTLLFSPASDGEDVAAAQQRGLGESRGDRGDFWPPRADRAQGGAAPAAGGAAAAAAGGSLSPASPDEIDALWRGVEAELRHRERLDDLAEARAESPRTAEEAYGRGAAVLHRWLLECQGEDRESPTASEIAGGERLLSAEDEAASRAEAAALSEQGLAFGAPLASLAPTGAAAAAAAGAAAAGAAVAALADIEDGIDALGDPWAADLSDIASAPSDAAESGAARDDPWGEAGDADAGGGGGLANIDDNAAAAAADSAGGRRDGPAHAPGNNGGAGVDGGAGADCGAAAADCGAAAADCVAGGADCGAGVPAFAAAAIPSDQSFCDGSVAADAWDAALSDVPAGTAPPSPEAAFLAAAEAVEAWCRSQLRLSDLGSARSGGEAFGPAGDVGAAALSGGEREAARTAFARQRLAEVARLRAEVRDCVERREGGRRRLSEAAKIGLRLRAVAAVRAYAARFSAVDAALARAERALEEDQDHDASLEAAEAALCALRGPRPRHAPAPFVGAPRDLIVGRMRRLLRRSAPLWVAKLQRAQIDLDWGGLNFARNLSREECGDAASLGCADPSPAAGDFQTAGGPRAGELPAGAVDANMHEVCAAAVNLTRWQCIHRAATQLEREVPVDGPAPADLAGLRDLHANSFLWASAWLAAPLLARYRALFECSSSALARLDRPDEAFSYFAAVAAAHAEALAGGDWLDPSPAVSEAPPTPGAPETPGAPATPEALLEAPASPVSASPASASPPSASPACAAAPASPATPALSSAQRCGSGGAAAILQQVRTGFCELLAADFTAAVVRRCDLLGAAAAPPEVAQALADHTLSRAARVGFAALALACRPALAYTVRPPAALLQRSPAAAAAPLLPWEAPAAAAAG